MTTTERQRDDMIAIIVEAADRHRVPRHVALAFAWCESRFDPRAAGDMGWHERDGGKLYVTRVVQQLRLRENPARSDPKAWHSYGLFQLLACFHVRPAEHPEVLYDPHVNADRGCAFIAQLLRRTGGDVEAARLRYVGLPLEGPNTEHARQRVLTKLRAALALFGAPPKEPGS